MIYEKKEKIALFSSKQRKIKDDQQSDSSIDASILNNAYTSS